jgi:hypothetical protein
MNRLGSRVENNLTREFELGWQVVADLAMLKLSRQATGRSVPCAYCYAVMMDLSCASSNRPPDPEHHESYAAPDWLAGASQRLEPGSDHEAALALSGDLAEPADQRAGPVAQS